MSSPSLVRTYIPSSFYGYKSYTPPRRPRRRRTLVGGGKSYYYNSAALRGAGLRDRFRKMKERIKRWIKEAKEDLKNMLSDPTATPAEVEKQAEKIEQMTEKVNTIIAPPPAPPAPPPPAPTAPKPKSPPGGVVRPGEEELQAAMKQLKKTPTSAPAAPAREIMSPQDALVAALKERMAQRRGAIEGEGLLGGYTLRHRKPWQVKGSKAAKLHMARLRAMRRY